MAAAAAAATAAATAAAAADEELKRRTDCVYFLASPLTCNKGNECEFRHSESARLNPRDCWYWRSGNCRNPACAFRHPPLEGTKQGPNLGHSTPYAAVEPSKPNVPCYFYFNAYCIKGDQCPFSHDMSQKIPKAVPEPTPVNPPQNKTATSSDTGPASVEVPATATPFGSTSEIVKQSHPKESQEPAQGSASEDGSPSSESSVPESDDPGIKLPDSPLPPVEYINGSNERPSQDRSSEEPENERVEHDEWWESSPGFDVLVDDGSEQLAYQDDEEYLLARERELDYSHLLPYDFDAPAGYDPMGYLNVGYDPYDRLEGRHTPEFFEKDLEQARERFMEPMIHRKRKGSHSEFEEDDRDGADLRDLLRKRRRVDVRNDSHMIHRHPSRARGNSRERPVRRRIGPLLNGRLSSEVGRNTIGSSHIESEFLWNDQHRNDHPRRGWSGYPHFDRLDRTRPRERERRKRARSPRIRAEFSQSKAANQAKPRQVSAAGFSGPKTLAQIREENRMKGDSDASGSREIRMKGDSNATRDPRRSRRTTSEDFEAPKPLNELLKNKRSRSSATGNTPSHAENGAADAHLEDSTRNYRGTAGRHGRKYDSDYDDDDEDDDLS